MFGLLNKKINTRGQGSLEMLIIFGILVIGAIIFSLVYVGNLKNASNESSSSETNNNLISDFNSGLNEYDNPPEFIASPNSNLPSGEYSSGVLIHLSTVTLQATIYYTTDGSAPSLASTQYTTPISLSNFTLKAIACKGNSECSAVSVFYYTVS